MSNEKQGTTTTTQTKSQPESIPIKLLRFVQSEDVPGSEMQQTLRGRKPGTETYTDADGKPVACHHAIERRPWMRDFRITYFDRSKKDEKRVVDILEHRVRSCEVW